MANEIELLSRLLAYEAGRALPTASHLRAAIRPDALVLCPLAMAGEDTTVHILAYGRVGQPARIECIPDPRRRDDQYRLFEVLGSEIESYFQECQIAGTYPQIWVASKTAVTHLDILADRLRYNSDNAPVKRCGQLLSFATERYPVAGQQALHPATSVLCDHYATGQQPGEDEHLGTILTWIRPPAGKNVLAAVAEVERMPMGVKTDPEFDRSILAPLVTAYNAAQRSGASPQTLAARAGMIQAALEPVARRIYHATQQAVRLLQRLELPFLPDLPALERREADEFASFMASRDAGYNLPLRDRPKSAAFKLSAREDAIQNLEAAMICGDRVARAQGRLSGRVLVGSVRNPQRRRIAPRRFEYRIELLSSQRALRVRRRDELCWVEDPRLKLTVTEVRRTGQATEVSLRISAGMRAVGPPGEGELLELVPAVPDWDNLKRSRIHLSSRLSQTPWTHAGGEAPLPLAAKVSTPLDPLAAVEALR